MRYYTIKRIGPADLTEEISRWLLSEADKANQLYGRNYKWERALIIHFARNYLSICFCDGEPIGFMCGSFMNTLWDKERVILRQNLLWTARPKSRAASMLMKDFIDFGKANANDIITMIASKTAIKPRSLKKLGFEEFEQTFKMEIR